MGNAYFYHLTRRRAEQVLPDLLHRALHAGWRVAVRGRDGERLAHLDQHLWLGPEEGFLPHGLADQPHAADQPILLTTSSDVPNGAQCLMTVDSAGLVPEEVAAFARVCVLFDGTDPQALDVARGQWKALKDAGLHALYWSEESGTWEKKAEANAPEG